MKGPEILANAVALGPLLREETAENERLRRLSAKTAGALRSAGAFRLPMPAAWGGPEVDIVTQTDIVEASPGRTGRPAGAPWPAPSGSASPHPCPSSDGCGKAAKAREYSPRYQTQHNQPDETAKPAKPGDAKLRASPRPAGWPLSHRAGERPGASF